MIKDAILSSCRKYRYALWRIWEPAKSTTVFIGLNPSTANENEDDPTIRRCMNYAKDWGYGGLCMANLFAYRATDPTNMMNACDPIGNDNDMWLKKLSSEAGIVIAAWGNNGVFLNRSNEVKQSIVNIHYLKLNKSGEPAHPLYLKKSVIPILMK